MLGFAAAVFLLIATPGPGVLSAAGVGVAYGMAAGLRYVGGLMIGNFLVSVLVVSGLAAAVLAGDILRFVLAAASLSFILYMAARIALAGSQLAFITAQGRPGWPEGFILRPINPKAHAVNAMLFSAFPILPGAYWVEVVLKLGIFNAIWLPLHVGWVWFGVSLRRLDLAPRTQRAINFVMAGSMLAVVALALSAA